MAWRRPTDGQTQHRWAAASMRWPERPSGADPDMSSQRRSRAGTEQYHPGRGGRVKRGRNWWGPGDGARRDPDDARVPGDAAE